MTQASLFRHQDYKPTPPTSPHHLLRPTSYPPVGTDAFRQQMKQVGEGLRRANVAAIYLVHGTFVGADALGVLAELARIFPSAGGAVRRVIKRIVDKVAGETGNYTPGFARCFEEAINAEAESPIPVRLFHWSSENHHLGRADGAVRLIAELTSRNFQPPQRILLWGHSHAGNVFALISNLLAGNVEAVDRFFEAGGIYYRWPVVGCVDVPVWTRVRELLAEATSPLAGTRLDMVTFGTPIRYGWNSDGYAGLLHFINHRPSEGLPAYRAPFPPKVDDVLAATDGDYIQQLGIAGTNVMPSVLAWRAWMADSRLNELLQPDVSRRDVLDRFKAGAIVPDEGTTLLVDYGQPDGSIAEHLAGHAVYTRRKWLAFHAEEVIRRLYGANPLTG